jgi:prophage regulatory protein
MAEQLRIALLRMRQVQALTGDSRSAAFEKRKAGLLPDPISIGARAKAYPEHEILAINSARIAGATDDQIRDLVKRLHTDRKNFAPGID